MFLPGNVNVNSSDMSDSTSDRTRFALLKGRGEGTGLQQILHYSLPIHHQTCCLLVLYYYIDETLLVHWN